MRSLTFVTTALLLAIPSFAQFQENTTPKLNCNNGNNNRDGQRFCEVREQRLPATAQLSVNAEPNGGISVHGWSRSEVLLRVKVEAQAPTEAEARSIASAVTVRAGTEIRSDGPRSEHDRRWNVSYELFVPHRMDLTLTTTNGGLTLEDVAGRLNLRTVNGGLKLARIAGKVDAKTENGGVKVDLIGSRWDGEGADFQTVNGGMHISMPSNFGAHVEASTNNGGVHSDFPELALDRRTRPRDIRADLNGGGAPLRFTTVNGGMHFEAGSAK